MKWRILSIWVIASLGAAATAPQAQPLRAERVLYVFQTSQQMQALFAGQQLAVRDPTTPSALRQRLVAFKDHGDVIDPNSPHGVRLSSETVQCSLYSRSQTSCRVVRQGDLPDNFLLLPRPPYEPFPPERTRHLDKWNTATGYITGRGLSVPRTASVLSDGALEAVSQRLNGISHVLMEIGLALVPVTQVQRGEEMWARANELAASDKPLVCDSDQNLCHVVTRLGAADNLDVAPHVGVCRAFRLIGKDRTSWMGPPDDCRIIASEIDGNRYVLAITEIMPQTALGGGFSGVVHVAGIPTENSFKQVLVSTLEGLRLTVDSARRTRIVSDTRPARLDPVRNAYLRRSIAASWEGTEEAGWSIDLDVTVLEHVQNRFEKAIALPRDIEQLLVDEFRDELRSQVAKRCKSVRREMRDSPTVICVDWRGP